MLKSSLKDPLEKYDRQEISMAPDHELRISHSFNRNVYIRLLDGSAEIFGCEMTFSYYLLPSDIKSISVFSIHGCLIEIFYEPEIKQHIRFYVHFDEDNYFPQLFALNSVLESHRRHAFTQLQSGPRTMIIGSENTGKFTLIRTLANYAVKNEWKPILADLDPLENKLASFGSISAAVLSEFVPFQFNEISKIAFFFGYDSLQDRFDFFSKQLKTLSAQIDLSLSSQLDIFKSALINGVFLESEHQRQFLVNLKCHIPDTPFPTQATLSHSASLSKHVNSLISEDPQKSIPPKLINDFIDKEIFPSGVFYNLPNEICLLKQQELQEIIDVISPDYVIIIMNDYLKSQLDTICVDRPITLVRFPKNSGVSSIDTVERKQLKANQIQNYFNSEQLMCIRDVLLTSDITIYQIESACNLPLKYITAVSEKNLILTKIDLSITDLKGRFLGLINLPVSDKIEIEDIISGELIALIYIIDCDGKTISLKRPQGIVENYQRFVLCVGNLGV